MENSDNNTSKSWWLCKVSSVDSTRKDSLLIMAWMPEPSVLRWENYRESSAICDLMGGIFCWKTRLLSINLHALPHRSPELWGVVTEETGKRCVVFLVACQRQVVSTALQSVGPDALLGVGPASGFRRQKWSPQRPLPLAGSLVFRARAQV